MFALCVYMCTIIFFCRLFVPSLYSTFNFLVHVYKGIKPRREACMCMDHLFPRL